ncbi:murein biosynthesis integral membrane protein MurJ [Croceivirga sp. JEA036]|uniref:murein biosynthesis integral membrane protein MurJ n=1 Tax=Croceivirga sp. JEA036 TaxID=2721162 RepID=UPI00143BE774|nr:lipid II flippase MurJ [Croceivirga sp. JEA036]NJB35367.1 virulence factor MviN [Croceivirga sp. JEA036]
MKVSILKLFKKNFSNKVLRNFAYVSLVTLLISSIGFLKETMVAANFGLSLELDSFFIALLIPGIINTVFLGSFNSVFIPNYIIELKSNNSIKSFQTYSLLITLSLAIVFSIITFLTIDFYLNILFPNKSNAFYSSVQNQTLILLPCIPLWGTSSILNGILNAHEEYRWSSFNSIFTPVSIIIGVSYFSNSTDFVLAYSTLVGAAFSATYLLIISKYKKSLNLGRPDSISPNLILTIKQIPVKISSSILTSLNNVVDQFFAAQLIVGSVAALNYGMKIPAFATSLLVMAINSVLLPYFSKQVLKDKIVAYEKLLVNLKWTFLIVMILSTIAIILSPFIIEVLFERNKFSKEDSIVVSYIQQIFLAFLPFKICGMLMVNFATSINKNSFLAFVSLIALILNVALDYIFIKYFGIYGIAICTTIVIIIKSLLIYLYIKKLHKNI